MNVQVLVTLLGRSLSDPRLGYRSVRYRFADGAVRETPYFALALAECLSVERLVILGTAGSMWGVLVENLAKAGEDEDLRLQLLDAEARGAVDQSLLDRLAPLMSRQVGRLVEPRLIGYSATPEEQRAVLRLMRDCVGHGERVAIDVTHGFRHLGMLGLQAATVLSAVAGVQVHGIWYGALDMQQDGVAPVLRLDGIAAMQEWLEALARYDESGNYAVFAELLERDGVAADKVRCLRDGAFFESVLNLPEARARLETFLQALDAPLPGASGLFQTRLRERLAWVRLGTRSARQLEQAERAIRHGDFLRACVFGFEALITRHCEQKGWLGNVYEERRPAHQEYEESLKRARDDGRYAAYLRLRSLRNALAHGLPPDDDNPREQKELVALLRDRRRLEEALRNCLDRLTALD